MSLVDRHLVAVLVLTSVLAGSSLVARGQQPASPPAAPAQRAVERGRYLVTVQDCNGCHTPFDKTGQPDMTRMLSGHPQSVTVTAGPSPALTGGWLVAINETNTAWSGPWGVSFTTNLTPDRATGMGAWTEQMFIRSIRQGKKGGAGRALLPPMPWPMYAKLTDDDLKAVFAYLRTIPAIANRVPGPIAPPGRGRGGE